MSPISKGIFLHSYALPMDQSLERAIANGFKYVQLWNIGGVHDPKHMTSQNVKEFQSLLDGNGVKISSLCGHLPLCDASQVYYNIPKLCSVIDLAVQLGAPTVTTETGMLPAGVEFDSAWKTLIRVLDAVSSYAAVRDCTLAIEAGSRTLVNSPELLQKMIEEVDSPALRINIDPANLYKAGHDPVEAVHKLKEYIVHAHAKDAKRVEDGFVEPRLGDGDVPLEKFIHALVEVGFAGTIAVEREAGSTREADILQASELVDKHLAAAYRR